MWWAVAAGCMLVGFVPVLAPSSIPEIDVARIRGHVDVIAQRPHPMGSTANEAVRDYLMTIQREQGLEPQAQTFEADDYFGAPGVTVDATNVITRIPGLGHDRALLLVAHYDSVPTSPGANDNAAAVAGLLEVSRLLSRASPPNDVIVLFTDGEEPAPRFGANAFTAHEWFPDVALVANFDANGSAGPAMLVEMSGPSGELVPHLSVATVDPVALSFVTDVTDLMGEIGTDFDVFRANGVPGYNFAFIRGSSIYHSPRDDRASLSERGTAHHASLALGLATQPIPSLEDTEADDVVFFTIPGGSLVRYGVGLARAFAFAAALFAGFIAVHRIRRGDTTARLVLGGVGRTLGGMGIAAFLATLVWIGIAELRPEMRTAESYVWLVLIVGIAATASWLTNRHRDDPVTGVLIVWAGLAMLTAMPLPGFATIFALPLIVACAAILYAELAAGNLHRGIRVIGVSIVTASLVVPALDTFFLLATPRPGNPDSELPSLIILPVILVLLVISLIATTIAPSPRDVR